MNPRLEVKAVEVCYGAKQSARTVLGPLSFSIAQGEILGVIGESGSGKSTLALALLDLLGKAARTVVFEAYLDGVALQELNKKSRRAALGGLMAFIPQEPMSALNPTLKVGFQIDLVLRRHLSVGKAERRAVISQALRRLRIEDTDRVLSAYPFELSGGQIQRILIAQAICLNAPLIIADEPTTALDLTVQAEVLSHLREAARNGGRSILFVSHSIGVVGALCDRILVMKDGRIVEEGDARNIINAPRHPYTRKLIAALPSLSAPRTPLPILDASE